MFGDLIIYKSGNEIKEAAKARLNANLINDDLPANLLEELTVLSRNPKDEDRFGLTVNQLIILKL